MALTVLLSRVKEKAGVTVSDFDAEATSLIADWVPVIEFALRPEILADPTSGLVKTLDLGATELVAAELLDQVARKPGYFDSLDLDGFSLQPWPSIVGSAGLLRDQGWARLRPYLRDDPGILGARGVAAKGSKNG
ncbi:MAG: hypothetical protein HONBIEJF_02099 [Fimbriimonadaceae bacterium]|nr:hypothetical protein [Fimbriimonadaceae bacterium]